jgi:hypothetical protein
MWIFQNDSFMSIVAHRTQPGRYLVRSRIPGDIERAVPDADVFQDPWADYRYRAVVTRQQLIAAVTRAVDGVDYPNFKASVPARDRPRYEAYGGVWQVMARAFGAFGLGAAARPRRTSGDRDVDAFLYDAE